MTEKDNPFWEEYVETCEMEGKDPERFDSKTP